MRLIAILLTLYLLSLSPEAQWVTEDEIPELKDSDFFVEDYPVQYAISPPSPFNVNKVNHQLRIMVLGGQGYDFPASFGRVSEPVAVDQDTFVLSEYSSVTDKRQIWLFDAGVLKPFQPACGNELTNGFSASLRWTPLETETGIVLCDIATGHTTAELPAGIAWKFIVEDNRRLAMIYPSDDGRYLVGIGYTEGDQVAFVGYDTLDRTFRALGQLEYSGNLPRILAWHGSEFGLPSGSGSLFVANAIIEGSLTEIETSVPTAWMHPNGREFGGGVGHPDSQAICGYWSYDLATDVLVQPDLQGLCYPEYGDIFGIGYYREETSTDRPLATLVRLDTQTGERRDLFTGEIEQILWVSEDERYAAIVSDETRIVEYLPGMHWQDRVRDEQGRNRVLHQPYLQFVELASGAVLARKPVSFHTIALRDPQYTYMMYPRDYYVPLHGVHQLTADSFLLLHCEVESIYGYCGRNDSTVTRLDLTDTGPVETVLARNAAEILPDLSGALIWNESGGTYSPTVDIYDFASQRTIPFLKEPIPPGSNYNIRVDHQTKAVQVEVDLYVIAPHDGRFEYFLPDLTFESDGTRHLTKWLQPFPSIGADICLVRPNRGANIRVQPDTASELFSTAGPGEMLRVAAKVEIGGVTWWQLRDGGYIHGSVVDASGACTVLPASDAAYASPFSSAAPPISITCRLTVLIGVNFRSLPTTDGERVGSADVDMVLLADGYEFNAADQFRWWRLTTGEWLREDFVSEAPDCINVLPAGQSPQPARAQSAFTCKLNVLVGANLRAGPSVDMERAGSAAEGFELTADGQARNEAEQFTWWRLTTGEWVREDFVSEEERCAELPEIVP